MKILIATDGSDFSKAAIEKCCRIVAEPESARIKIVSAYQTVVPFDINGASIEYAKQMEEAARRNAEKFVAKAADSVGACFPNRIWR